VKYCINCGVQIPKEAKFCSICGGIQEVAKYSTTNTQPKDEKRESFSAKLTNKISNKKVKYPLIAILALCLAGATTYFSMMYFQNSDYVSRAEKTLLQMKTADDEVSVAIDTAIAKRKLVEAQSVVTKKFDEVKKVEENLSSKQPGDSYVEQNDFIIKALKNEEDMLTNIGLLVANPLGSQADDIISKIKTCQDVKDSLFDKITLNEKKQPFSGDLRKSVSSLIVYVNEQRKINKEKLITVAANKEYFAKMDGIIQRYESAKKDLGSMFDQIYSGAGYTWNDLYNASSGAGSMRSAIRYEVSELSPPKGAEEMRQQFVDLLSDAVMYCEMMETVGRFGMNNNFDMARQHRAEASSFSDKLQVKYADFKNNYETVKQKLTNVDALPN